jgi:hypothetical protein
MSSHIRRFPFAHVLNQLLHTVLAGAIVMSAAHFAAAQALSGLVEGSRVRVTSVGVKQVTGVVKSTSPDTTTLFVEGNGGVLKIANANITGLRVSRGRSAAEGAKRGALWGGAIGTALAVAIVASVNSDPNYTDKSGLTGYAVSTAVGGALWGAGIGAFTKAEKWDKLPLR